MHRLVSPLSFNEILGKISREKSSSDYLFSLGR